MASLDAIAAVSRAILGLLEDSYPRSLFGQLDFSLVHPAVFDESQAARAMDGVTLCLWRVSPNGTPRQRGPRLGPDGRRFRPSLPLDLYYLVTPWASNVEKQQRMLGWLMRRLADMAVLPAAELNRRLNINDAFAPDEQVELVQDAPALADWLAIWDKLKPRLQSSALYLARGIAIDSDIPMAEGDPVAERRFEFLSPRSVT